MIGLLVGMITIDDIIDVIDEEAEEDLMALAGVGGARLQPLGHTGGVLMAVD